VGRNGDSKSKLQKTASFTEFKPLNVYQNTHTAFISEKPVPGFTPRTGGFTVNDV